MHDTHVVVMFHKITSDESFVSSREIRKADPSGLKPLGNEQESGLGDEQNRRGFR